MLGFDDFFSKLKRDRERNDWLRVFVDEHDRYHLCAYAGMGDMMFQELQSDHPFVRYVKDLESSGKLERQPFRKEYYAGGIDLAEFTVC